MAPFEWDSNKEEENIRKHGVDFTIASQLWDRLVFERIDDRRNYGEIRFLAFGEIEGRVLAVVLHGVEWHAGSFPLERQIQVKEHSSMKKRGGEVEHRRTDWSRFDAKTLEQIDADIRDDLDAAPIVNADWFASANLVVPQPKEQISIRLDREVLEHFRQYPRYQTRINAILRAVMEHEKKTKAG